MRALTFHMLNAPTLSLINGKDCSTTSQLSPSPTLEIESLPNVLIMQMPRDTFSNCSIVYSFVIQLCSLYWSWMYQKNQYIIVKAVMHFNILLLLSLTQDEGKGVHELLFITEFDGWVLIRISFSPNFNMTVRGCESFRTTSVVILWDIYGHPDLRSAFRQQVSHYICV